MVGSMVLHQPAQMLGSLFHLLDGHAQVQGSTVARLESGDTLLDGSAAGEIAWPRASTVAAWLCTDPHICLARPGLTTGSSP
jgi:hypothetical protein